MALQNSGQITLNQIHKEAGNVGGTQSSLNDADIRGLIGKASGAQMAMSEWYGASSSVLDFSTDLPRASSWYSSYGSTYGDCNWIDNGADWNMQPRGQQSTQITSEFYGATSIPAGNYVIDYDLQINLGFECGGQFWIGRISGTPSGFKKYNSSQVRNEEILFLRSSSGTNQKRVDDRLVNASGSRVTGTCNYYHAEDSAVGFKSILFSSSNVTRGGNSCYVHSFVIRNA